MSIYYDRPFQVSKWIIAQGLSEKQKEVLLKVIPKNGATFMPWPSLLYKDEIMKYANLGYAEYIQPVPYFLDMTSLGVRAASSLMKNYNEMAQLSGKPLYHRIVNNRVLSDEDYTRIMNEILAVNDDLSLSQLFGLAEKTDQIYVSFDACLAVVQKIASKVIIVGNGDTFDIDITDKSQKELLVIFSSIFKE